MSSYIHIDIHVPIHVQAIKDLETIEDHETIEQLRQ